MARRTESPGRPRTTYAMRLGDDERKFLEAAAAVQSEPLSAYIRRVALEAARRDLGEGGR